MRAARENARPLPGVPNWFSVLASSLLAAGKAEGWGAKPRVLVIDGESASRELLSQLHLMTLANSGRRPSHISSHDAAS